jgi:hypothetical protein
MASDYREQIEAAAIAIMNLPCHHVGTENLMCHCDGPGIRAILSSLVAAVREGERREALALLRALHDDLLHDECWEADGAAAVSIAMHRIQDATPAAPQEGPECLEALGDRMRAERRPEGQEAGEEGSDG